MIPKKRHVAIICLAGWVKGPWKKPATFWGKRHIFGGVGHLHAHGLKQHHLVVLASGVQPLWSCSFSKRQQKCHESPATRHHSQIYVYPGNPSRPNELLLGRIGNPVHRGNLTWHPNIGLPKRKGSSSNHHVSGMYMNHLENRCLFGLGCPFCMCCQLLWHSNLGWRPSVGCIFMFLPFPP